MQDSDAMVVVEFQCCANAPFEARVQPGRAAASTVASACPPKDGARAKAALEGRGRSGDRERVERKSRIRRRALSGSRHRRVRSANASEIAHVRSSAA
jgi:hypothetical protein